MDGAKRYDTQKLIMPDNITLIKLPPIPQKATQLKKVSHFPKENFLSHKIWHTVTDIVYDGSTA
jgi:hypothetical protein